MDFDSVDALAQDVRSNLSEQERLIFDTLWKHGPQELDALMSRFDDRSKEAKRQILFGLRSKLIAFSRSSKQIPYKYRLSIPKRTRTERLYRINVEANICIDAAGFWSDHLMNSRTTCIVIGEPWLPEQTSYFAFAKERDRFSLRPIGNHSDISSLRTTDRDVSSQSI